MTRSHINKVFAEIEDCHEKGICINCGHPALARCKTDKGKEEYWMSAVCEECYDQIEKEKI